MVLYIFCSGQIDAAHFQPASAGVVAERGGLAGDVQYVFDHYSTVHICSVFFTRKVKKTLQDRSPIYRPRYRNSSGSAIRLGSNSSSFEAPPPGPGLVTVMIAGVLNSLLVILKLTCVPFTAVG